MRGLSLPLARLGDLAEGSPRPKREIHEGRDEHARVDTSPSAARSKMLASVPLSSSVITAYRCQPNAGAVFTDASRRLVVDDVLAELDAELVDVVLALELLVQFLPHGRQRVDEVGRAPRAAVSWGPRWRGPSSRLA